LRNSEKIVNLSIDKWLKEIFVDPISKSPFEKVDDFIFKSPCGFIYNYKSGVPDFRVNAAGNYDEWAFGQEEFESWFLEYLNNGESDPNFYHDEVLRDAAIYEKFGILSKGRVLDVGGQLGHIRKFLAKNQEYCSVDPFTQAHELAANRKNLFSTYPLADPLNLIAGFAEFLPFREMSFQVVNMRSCLDHFFNPQQALLEAFRVLQPGGHLIIGLTLEGQTTKAKIKDLIRPIAAAFFHKFKDHHMWHPTYANLKALTENCGFTLIDEFWQTSDVLYALFLRNDTHKISTDSKS
jgi:SAM-dependent methyltransferase